MSKKSAQPVKALGLQAFVSDTSLNLDNENVIEISVDKIDITPHQTRRYICPDEIELMAHSISEHGVITPILVSPRGDRYDLVYGQKRLRGAIAAGLNFIKSHVKELNYEQQLELALVENLHREDLNPIDEVDGILALLALRLKVDLSTSEQICRDLLYVEMGRLSGGIYSYELSSTGTTDKRGVYNYEPSSTGTTDTNNIRINLDEAREMFDRVSRANLKSFVTNQLPLLKLPAHIIEAIRQGQIAYSKARIISRIEDEEFQQQLLQEAIADNLTRQQISNKIKEYKEGNQDKEEEKEATLQEQATQIFKKVKQKVGRIESSAKQKKIKKLLQELDRLIDEE